MRKLKVTRFVLLLTCLIFALRTIVFSTAAQAAAVAAINCGGSAYTASDGTVYSADTDYSGGSTYATTSPIAGTSDPTLYQNQRYGNFSYNIPLANGNYNVTLKFAELYWNAAGKRVFDVSMQGTQVINNLDVYALVGENTAHDVTTAVSVTNGILNIDFTSVVNLAIVNAIEITQGSQSSGSSGSSGSSVYGVFYTSNGAIGRGQGFTVTKDQNGTCWDITFTSASLHHNYWPACLATAGFSNLVAEQVAPDSYCAWTYVDTNPNGTYTGPYDGYICCTGGAPPGGPLSISFICQW